MADSPCATTHCMRSGINTDAPFRRPWTELDAAATQDKAKHFDKEDSSDIIEPNFEGVLSWLRTDVQADSAWSGMQRKKERSGTASTSDDELGATASSHASETPVLANAALKASSDYHCEVSPCELKIVVEGTAADLWRGLVTFFQEGNESEVCELDSGSLQFKAIIFYDFTPIDADVSVFEANDIRSFALFSHPSRSDSVRFAQTLQLAAQHLMVVGLSVLQPRKGFGDGCLRLVDGDMSIPDDDWCLDDAGILDEASRQAIQPLLHQACSGLQRKRKEAATELAMLAKAAPRLRAHLAEALVAHPEVLKCLFSTGSITRPADALVIQYPVAAMLASVADDNALQGGMAEMLMNQVLRHADMTGDGTNMPRLVARELTVALGLLRCKIDKLGRR